MRLTLIIQHFLFRLRKPRHPRLFGTLLLLLSPVGYEMAPILRWGKASSLLQRMEQFLVERVSVQDACRVATSQYQTSLEISAIDEQRLRELLANVNDFY